MVKQNIFIDLLKIEVLFPQKNLHRHLTRLLLLHVRNERSNEMKAMMSKPAKCATFSYDFTTPAESTAQAFAGNRQIRPFVYRACEKRNFNILRPLRE